MEERRKHCPLEEEVETLNRVIFGDKETGELGMHDMVKEMYAIMTGAKNLIAFIDRFGTLIKWIAGVGIAIAVFKGWFAGLVAIIIGK